MLKQHEELITAPPYDGVVGPDDGLYARCYGLKDTVTSCMGVHIIDALEPVQIYEHSSQRLSLISARGRSVPEPLR